MAVQRGGGAVLKETAAPSVPPAEACASCGVPHDGRWCPHCGERRLEYDDLTLRGFLSRSLAAVFDADSRLVRSFVTLVRRPGRLTADYLRGRRRPWLAPIQLFLLANLVYFLTLFVVPWNTFTTPLSIHLGQTMHADLAQRLVDVRIAEGRDFAEYQVAFDVVVEAQARTLLILIVPVIALISWLLWGRSERRAVPHLVFALHGFGFLLLVVSPVLYGGVQLLQGLARLGVMLPPDLTLSLSAVVVFAVYNHLAARVVYGEGRARTAVKAALLGLGVWPALMVYRFLLFMLAWLVV